MNLLGKSAEINGNEEWTLNTRMTCTQNFLEFIWHLARNVEFPQGMMTRISQGMLKPTQGMLKPPQGMLRLRKGWQEFASNVEKLDVDAPIAGA